MGIFALLHYRQFMVLLADRVDCPAELLSKGFVLVGLNAHGSWLNVAVVRPLSIGRVID